MQIDFLTKVVKEAVGALSKWEKWTPDAERNVLEGRIRTQKENTCDLEVRKGEFARARRAAEDVSVA